MQSIELHAHTYEERYGLIPDLNTTVARCGAWIVDRRTLSPTTLELRIEIQLRSVVELYATLLSSGLEFTRLGHQALTHLCLCRKHLAPGIPNLVTIRLELAFLEDVTLHSLLMSQPCCA